MIEKMKKGMKNGKWKKRKKREKKRNCMLILSLIYDIKKIY